MQNLAKYIITYVKRHMILRYIYIESQCNWNHSWRRSQTVNYFFILYMMQEGAELTSDSQTPLAVGILMLK